MQTLYSTMAAARASAAPSTPRRLAAAALLLGAGVGATTGPGLASAVALTAGAGAGDASSAAAGVTSAAGRAAGRVAVTTMRRAAGCRARAKSRVLDLCFQSCQWSMQLQVAYSYHMSNKQYGRVA